MRKARLIVSVLALAMLAGLCGCGRKEQVKLTVWGSEASQEMLREMADEFIELHAKEADIEIVLRVEDEDTVADNAVNNPERLADVFSFAGDQLPRLTNAGILLPIEQGAEEVIEANGGADSAAIQEASRDGVLYAYPLTASNGYFMYYNAEYFDESDVETLDGMLRAAEKAGKSVAMDWTSGWYIYSFFGGAGMQISLAEDGKSNICDWNRTDGEYHGTDVAEAMLSIASSSAFLNTNDEGFREGIESGQVIAGVNGPWNVEFVRKQWGDQYRAVKLPTYTLKGKQVQMGSFAGYKLMGVKAASEYPEWASEFAAYITNEENQLKRFHVTGECPSNVKAAQSEQVQASPAVMALGSQAAYSTRQSIAGSFWTPATVFGTIMASGNPDGRDLQELLDELAEAARMPEE
ncbi:MAG: extracellular solute-binding protein [Clostridium sp.]|nr:extracellular solute-binding protein [Acetatifactor muris]MCM1526063.1 extracellular solute-binding protein [Bacteroides sp.]MCM1562177.1 extracellular solute-binding protein [Clostridium sp.]